MFKRVIKKKLIFGSCALAVLIAWPLAHYASAIQSGSQGDTFDIAPMLTPDQFRSLSNAAMSETNLQASVPQAPIEFTPLPSVNPQSSLPAQQSIFAQAPETPVPAAVLQPGIDNLSEQLPALTAPVLPSPDFQAPVLESPVLESPAPPASANAAALALPVLGVPVAISAQNPATLPLTAPTDSSQFPALEFAQPGENLSVFQAPASVGGPLAATIEEPVQESWLPSQGTTNQNFTPFPAATDVYGFKTRHAAEVERFDSVPGWQTPTTPTPGHNERANMSKELSLTPPPNTGEPISEYLPVQPPAFGPDYFPTKFDQDVGYRREQQTRRFDSYSLNDGDKFGYETKKRDFPPFDEIIATGRFFYNAEVLWAEPQFQGNTLISTTAPGFRESLAGDFDSDFHPRVRFGFESPYGPGIEFTYFNINSNSELSSFTSDGITTGITTANVIGRNELSEIFADDVGETLVTQHSLDIDSATVSFFKELKFPVSRINGNFGFQYVSVAQLLNANVTAADGTVVETLQSSTDLRAWGPRAIIEYYRPIGHTPLELVTAFGGSVLFGQRDQFVTNSETGAINRFGADEFLTIIDFLLAVQFTKNVGENRGWYGRFGYINQTWIGGGSATIPEGDFGLRGLTFGIGYNR